jgi:hypothetical protein
VVVCVGSVDDADGESDGDCVALAAETDGAAEEAAGDGEALDADAALAADVVVLTAGAPPVVVGPQPASTVSAMTASPATIRAKGPRAITTPFSVVDTS